MVKEFSSNHIILKDWNALSKDESRGITDISYDNSGNPILISFANGRNISNVYSSTGERLKTVSYGSLISQSNPMAALDADLDPLSDDAPEYAAASGVFGQVTVEYYGPLIYRNGKVDMILFPGSYATLSGSNATFHYYTQDYLGNNSAVINISTWAIDILKYNSKSSMLDSKYDRYINRLPEIYITP
ncbi:MAG: hypothetical protein K2K32_09430 [Muribaculaceae bacterium]|nr:hypothetical protein [Muribaculaceae bacterium]